MAQIILRKKIAFFNAESSFSCDCRSTSGINTWNKLLKVKERLKKIPQLLNAVRLHVKVHEKGGAHKWNSEEDLGVSFRGWLRSVI